MADARNSDASTGDFTIEVYASSLRRTRRGLEQISKHRYRPSELCLTLASLTAGGFLSALQRGIGSGSNYWWLYCGVLPALALSSMVAYLLLKHLSAAQPAAVARDLLTDFPDQHVAQTVPPIDWLAGTWHFDSTTATSGKTSKGMLNFDVTRGRITAAGQLYGESDDPIADAMSHICEYDPATKYLVMVYRLSTHDDGGSQAIVLCVLSGIVFADPQGNPTLIKANWFQLDGSPIGKRPFGSAMLKPTPNSKSNQGVV